MGCASSKVLGPDFTAEQKLGSYGSLARGISMPTQFIHHPESPEDFHIVALTSSTYGILKVDPPKATLENEGKDAMAVKEVLNKLNTLESKEDSGPQSWLEVSSMLENLKPSLEAPSPANNPTKASAFGKAQKPPLQHLDSIDINEIMMDIDEDTGLLKSKASLARRATLKRAGNSLPIRTLEELDKRMGGGKENIIKNPPPVTTDFRGLLKPINGNGNAKTVDASEDPSKEFVMRSGGQKGVPAAAPVKKNSELLDGDLLESYKSAFPTLSDDDWRLLDPQEDMELEPKQAVQGSEVADTTSSSIEAREYPSATSNLKGEAGDRKLVMEGKVLDDDEKASSEMAVPKASPLESYEDLCPPGGKHAVVFYTTSLRGIRKTYEDCIRVRDILQSYGVLIDERDVSKHLEYRNELRELMDRLVTLPRLFINGKYIGGVEKVCKLEEEGQLACLLEGSTRARCSQEGACDGCANERFVPCFTCNGSRKIVDDGRRVVQCVECNENGLVQCPICS